MKRVLVNLAVVAAIFAFLVANYIATEAKSWRAYSAPVDQVYAATLKAIEAQGHSARLKNVERESSSSDPRSSYELDLRLRMKPFGGYSAHLWVRGGNDSTSVTVIPAAFPSHFPFAFGGGQEEVRKIFVRMDADLCSADKSKCPSKPPR